MNDNFPYIDLLKIIKKRREIMIYDTVNRGSPDLYDALYSDSDSKISEIKLELYEMKWLQSYWKEVERDVGKRDISVREKKVIISKFSKWYENFLRQWNYSMFDALAFEEKIEILRAMITVNNDWDENLKRMTVSFTESIRKLEKEIKKLEEE